MALQIIKSLAQTFILLCFHERATKANKKLHFSIFTIFLLTLILFAIVTMKEF